MVDLVKVDRRYEGRTVICAATGPSLDASRIPAGVPVIAVSDAYKALPNADVLYSADSRWWRHHDGVPEFRGERWSTHGPWPGNDKSEDQFMYRLHLVEGRRSGDAFSSDSSYLEHGANSGFQAINLAILFGARRVVLVGYDMRWRDGRSHYFGDHARPLTNSDPRRFVPRFHAAARSVPAGVDIINATRGSAITCWPYQEVEDALKVSA